MEYKEGNKMWPKKAQGNRKMTRSRWNILTLYLFISWSTTALANSEFSYETRNDAGGEIVLTNLGDINPGVKGKSSYQSLILTNSDFIYSVQAIERDSYDGDFILHRYDGNAITEVTQLPFQYDFEIGIPRYVSERNKVIFLSYGTEDDFLVFDGASEQITLHSIGDATDQPHYHDHIIFGASDGFTFVGSSYPWGENDGRNIDKVFRLSQDENIEIALPINTAQPLDQQVVIFSDGIFVKGDVGYILLDNSTSVAQIGTLQNSRYLFEWRNKLIFQEENSENIVWLDKQSLELQSFPGYLLGHTNIDEDINALVKVGEQIHLWSFGSDGSHSSQNLPFPAELSSVNIKVNGATSDSIYLVSIDENQSSTVHTWWRLELSSLEFHSLTSLLNGEGSYFTRINNVAFLRDHSDLWRSEGSSDSTEKVTLEDGVLPQGHSPYIFDNSLLIESDSSQFGREWLLVDENGNSQVIDVVPGSVGSDVSNRQGDSTLFKERFYSLQNVPSTGYELYDYPDSSSLPTLAYDLTPVAIGYDSMSFLASVYVSEDQSMAYVDSLNTNTGKKIFFTDGTPENSGVVPDEPGSDYKRIRNYLYREEPLSVSKFNPENQTFEDFVTLHSNTSSYDLIEGHDEWLIYSFYRSDLQRQELWLSDGITEKHIFTSNHGSNYYPKIVNGHLYFYDRVLPDYSSWDVYRYDFANDELTSLFEVKGLYELKVGKDYEALVATNQDGYLEISRFDENNNLIPIFTNEEAKHYHARDSLFDGKVVLLEKDPQLQPFMDTVGIHLFDITTGQLETLPITERLETREYSISFQIYNHVIKARISNVNGGDTECLLLNSEAQISGDGYCNAENFDVGDDILILSARPTSVRHDDYENYVQVLDRDLNILFDYQTASTRYRQNRFQVTNDGLLYFVGNEDREELWWKGINRKEPIKILNDYLAFVESSGLNSLRDLSWRAVNGKILMRGEEDAIGAEPFVLDLFCNPEMMIVSETVDEVEGSYSMNLTPGTTHELKFTIKSMLPKSVDDIGLPDIADLTMQLTKEENVFTLNIEVSNEFTGSEELTLSVDGECGNATNIVSLQASEIAAPVSPSPDKSGGNSSPIWLLTTVALVWFRRMVVILKNDFFTTVCKQ